MHASATSPFAAGEVDGHGATQDGHIGRCRRARDKAAKGGSSACGEQPRAGEGEWHCLFCGEIDRRSKAECGHATFVLSLSNTKC